MKNLKTFLTLIIPAILFGACESAKTADINKDGPICISDSLARIIRIDTAISSNIHDELKLSGEVSFNDNKLVKVFPFSSGQVIQVLVSLGDHVQKGQRLAILRS